MWDAAENTFSAAMGILQGGGVDVEAIGRGIIRPIREGMTLQNALQVGAAAGITGVIRRIIPGSGKSMMKMPTGVPLLGGYKIKRF